jgi:hypothetical protein
MQRRIDLIRGLARRLPGTDGLAAASAAAGDPAPLLELRATRMGRPHGSTAASRMPWRSATRRRTREP